MLLSDEEILLIICAQWNIWNLQKLYLQCHRQKEEIKRQDVAMAMDPNHRYVIKTDHT